MENVWPDKIDYSLSTPTKAVIFGTNLQIDFRLIPLLKGLKIGKITTEFNEKQEMTIKGPRIPHRSRQISRNIAKDEYRLPCDAEAEDIDGQEGFVFSRYMTMPQSLKQCLQTVDALGIKIRHSLSFNVQLHNPDGHVSEVSTCQQGYPIFERSFNLRQLHATIPLFIFISPNMPLDDNNNLVHHGESVHSTAAMDTLTPPQYGEHQFDQLYSNIDPCGYMTPAGGASGMGTPFQSRSRSVSVEDLASMDGVASSDLAASLSNIAFAGSNRIARDRTHFLSSGNGNEVGSFEVARTADAGTPPYSPPRGGYFVHPEGIMSRQSPGGSNPESRRGSEDDGVTSSPVTPQHIEYSAESLAKVPSYTTALQTHPRTPVNDGLPTYQNATRTPLASMSLPVSPSQVHTHPPTRRL